MEKMIFSTFSKLKIGALFVGNDGLFLARREKLVALAARHAIASIYHGASTSPLAA